MWYKIEKNCLHFSVYLIISLSQVMGGLNLMCIWQKKICRELPHTKTCIWFKYPPINVHWTSLVVTWIWLWPLTDILQKLLLSDGDPRMLLLQRGWGSLGFCSVFSDNFFVVTYTYLSLVLSNDFCYSQLIIFCILFKKDTKINK